MVPLHQPQVGEHRRALGLPGKFRVGRVVVGEAEAAEQFEAQGGG
jgi:hypothetical protein